MIRNGIFTLGGLAAIVPATREELGQPFIATRRDDAENNRGQLVLSDRLVAPWVSS